MKRIIIILLFTLAGTFLFGQADEIAYYNLMYDNSTTIREKVLLIEEVQQAALSGAESFYARALDNLVNIYPRQTEINEINAADRAAILLSRSLGDAGYTAAGPGLWYIANEFKGGQDTPLAKATALEALGKVKALDFLPQVIQVLANINARPPADRDTQIQNERIAYGAILSLEHYGEQSGYEAVFFASLGWYSLRVKRQATESLGKIMEDPSEHLIRIINAPSYVGLPDTVSSVEVKYEALKVGEDSSSPDNHKAAVAAVALNQGHYIRPIIRYQQETQIAMRKMALNMLRRYGTEDNAVYPLIDRSYRDGAQDEKLTAINTFAALGGETSAQYLSTYLRELHTRRTADAGTMAQKQDEDTLIRVIIPALGQIGPPARNYAASVLRLIQNTNTWTGYVQGIAREALAKIGN